MIKSKLLLVSLTRNSAQDKTVAIAMLLLLFQCHIPHDPRSRGCRHSISFGSQDLGCTNKQYDIIRSPCAQHDLRGQKDTHRYGVYTQQERASGNISAYNTSALILREHATMEPDLPPKLFPSLPNRDCLTCRASLRSAVHVFRRCAPNNYRLRCLRPCGPCHRHSVLLHP